MTQLMNFGLIRIVTKQWKWHFDLLTMDFINLSNENESLLTLKCWFFELSKSYINALLFIVLRKESIVFFY